MKKKETIENKAIQATDNKTVNVEVIRTFSVDGVTYVVGEHSIPAKSLKKVSKIYYK